MEILNLSGEPTAKLLSWLPHRLRAERIVFMPDACPGTGALPTGTVVMTRQPDWRQFAVSDCGCGMRLVRTQLRADEVSQAAWDELAAALRKNRGGLGDLGGGNHFLDALAPLSGDRLHLLIHTGSRRESGHVDSLIEDPGRFDAEFARIVAWAADNRAAVQAAAECVLGPLTIVLDLPHNTYEKLEGDEVIIRRGAVRVEAGALNVIPSHMSGEVALVRATPRVTDSLLSLSHGTGRTMSRADGKAHAATFDFAALRSRVLFPSGLDDASLRAEGPYAYRDLDDCLALLNGFVEVIERFEVAAYMGHL